jgi:hypothetical protein
VSDNARDAVLALFRIRKVRAFLVEAIYFSDAPDCLVELNDKRAGLERYERRAFSRRNRALQRGTIVKGAVTLGGGVPRHFPPRCSDHGRMGERPMGPSRGHCIGAGTFVQAPRGLCDERLHGDDTTVLAKGKTDTGRIWVYVRDDKPFGGQALPGAVFYYSRNRAGAHPQAHLANSSGIFQADAYGGYGKLYEPGRTPGPILEAARWVHARRPFFVMLIEPKMPVERLSPLALETVRRIDALFEIEWTINGQNAERRKAVR